jgi:hypothetical protein
MDEPLIIFIVAAFDERSDGSARCKCAHRPLSDSRLSSQLATWWPKEVTYGGMPAMECDRVSELRLPLGRGYE